MLLSTVEKVKLTVSDQVKTFGYTALVLALSQLIRNRQRKLAAMIMVALCLAPRKTGVENSGVKRVIRNLSLLRLGKEDSTFIYELRHQAEQSVNQNKVEITLRAAGWFQYPSFWPNKENPWLQANDGCIFFNSKNHSPSHEGFQHMLCDHAGTQRYHYFPHFRMIWEDSRHWGVRVIGRQFDRSRGTLANAKPLPNGYYEYSVPVGTVLHGFGDNDGRTLEDLLEPGVWYNAYFQPDTALDLVDHEPERERKEVYQNLANVVMKIGQLNG